jgi:hypothetical protein
MKKSTKELEMSQDKLENSQTSSTQPQLSINRVTSKKLGDSLKKLSDEQLQQAILTGSQLADYSELMKLKLRHHQYLKNQQLKKSS